MNVAGNTGKNRIKCLCSMRATGYLRSGVTGISLLNFKASAGVREATAADTLPSP